MEFERNGVRPAPMGEDSSSVDTAKEKSNSVATNGNNTTMKELSLSSETGSCSTNKYTELKGDIIARLGFEPDGSATKPSFCESCISLRGLLSDRNGYRAFYDYLQQHNHESLLDFWSSCEEFKRLAQSGSNLTNRSANSTYNNFMHKRQLCGELLQDAIRAKVKHKLNSGQVVSESTFDAAQETILSYLNEFHYPSFMRLDANLKRCSESVGKSTTTTTTITNNMKERRNVARFGVRALEPLPEERILALEGETPWTHAYESPRSICRPMQDVESEGYLLQNQNLSKAVLAAMYTQPAPVVSVNDSDVQSLSSDALTDDSKSTVTDYSELASKANDKRPGQHCHDIKGFLPRTKRLPKGRKQLTPEEFARVLCEKLEKVRVLQEQEERAAINLASSSRDYLRENKKSILEDAAERHHQYQQAGRFGLGLPAPKFTETCYPLHGGNSSIISSSSHTSYSVEPRQIPTGYNYPSSEHTSEKSAGNSTWRMPTEKAIEKPQKCGPLLANKKQWESVGTIESAPDSGVNLEEDNNLAPEARHRILQWMDQGEKVTTQIQQANYSKNTSRSKHPAYNTSCSAMSEPGAHNLRPIAQDPLMPPLPQPNTTTTIEEVSRRLSQKNPREKRSKLHHKSRPGYVNSRSSCPPQFSSDSGDCASSVLSGDYNRPAIYSSSSVLSSVPSSNDSGLGAVQKKNKKQVEGVRILYHLPGESVPYQSSLPGKVITLGQFKELINFKKGNYRYYCYNKTHEKDVEAVFEEITDDNAALPCFGNKIICKVREA